MAVQFAVLASGSRGNSTLVRDCVGGLLIDVGMGPKELGQRLESVGSSWSQIAAVALTHTHGDHVDSATFSELARRRASLYCHEGHRAELAGKPGFQKLEEAGLIRSYDERPFLTTTGLRLEPIRLRHDGGPTYGFRIEVSAERRRRPVSIGYLADTGTWTESMADSLADVEVLGVEFNHDLAMQKSSGRPHYLIARILSDEGHLSNGQGADLVQAVLSRSRKKTLRHLVLLHLSEQCNQPELAIRAAREAIRVDGWAPGAGQGTTEGRGHHPKVHAARQSPAYPNLWINPSRTPPTRPRKRPVAFPALPGLPCLIRWDRDHDQD
jgi:phosphoribosyl 1,2-cyclic phosphodiesterase